MDKLKIQPQHNTGRAKKQLLVSVAI